MLGYFCLNRYWLLAWSSLSHSILWPTSTRIYINSCTSLPESSPSCGEQWTWTPRPHATIYNYKFLEAKYIIFLGVGWRGFEGGGWWHLRSLYHCTHVLSLHLPSLHSHTSSGSPRFLATTRFSRRLHQKFARDPSNSPIAIKQFPALDVHSFGTCQCLRYLPSLHIGR